MANNSSDIRRLMSLVESVQEPALLEGWLTNLKNKRITRLGNKEREEMANRLKKEWLKWLGQTNREGAIDDMERFMRVRIGFKEEDIAVVMDRVLDTSNDPSNDTKPSSDADQEPPERKIARGEPEDQEQEQDKEEPDDGKPLPKDLDTKLSDYGKVGKNSDKGISVSTDPEDLGKGNNANNRQRSAINDDAKKYLNSNGKWDKAKIKAKLDTMVVGDQLILGDKIFSYNVSSDGEKNESIMEADESAILDDETVDDFMDVSAAHINDAYLLNGPVNDTNDAIADLAQQKGLQGSSRKSSSSDSKSTSGPYDIQEMSGILKRELEIGDAKLKQITQYVKDTADKGYGRMQDSDIDVLARIGYALLRSRT